MTAGIFDAEALVADYLHQAVTAALELGPTDLTVRTELPADIDAAIPLIAVGFVGSSFVDRGTKRVARVRLDVAYYAAGRDATVDLAIAGTAALAELEHANYDHAAGVVTAVDFDLGPFRSPDPETDRERYLCTVAIFGHRRDTPPAP